MNKTRELYDDEHHLTPDNLSIAQALLKQTNSIDETARLMCETNSRGEFLIWQKRVIEAVEQNKLII